MLATNSTWPKYEDLLEGHITTFTGRQIDPLAMTPDQADIRDIAHALANSNRWIGHTRQPFSVAAHCLIGAKLIDPAYALEFLLHDATEAYLPDMPRPLKVRPEFMFYRQAEQKIAVAIAAAFDLPAYHSVPVLEMDARMALAEYEVLMAGTYDRFERIQPQMEICFGTLASDNKAATFEAAFYRLMFERHRGKNGVAA
jgi:5'-deoxynucleotidase YfbR-like HD superfamily hydrolase